LTEHASIEKADLASLKSRRVKHFLMFLLVVSIIVEGFYIYLLKDKIEKQDDELKDISVQLQFLKNEREDLKASLSSANKTTGDPGNGNTTER
jgi:peptidoglycan hydrolase CwlO-like protein